MQNTARNIDFRSTVEARRPLNRPNVLSTPDNYANDASKRRLVDDAFRSSSSRLRYPRIVAVP